MVADRQGRLWIGTRGDGLVRVSRGNGVAVDQVARPGVSSYDVVLAVFEDREGNIWVGTPRGLDRGSRGLIAACRDRAAASRRRCKPWLRPPMGASGSGPPTDCIDSPRVFAVQPSTPSIVPGLRVGALHGDANGRMWVATAREIGRVDNGRFSR